MVKIEGAFLFVHNTLHETASVTAAELHNDNYVPASTYNQPLG